jgi:hypothetical protein
MALQEMDENQDPKGQSQGAGGDEERKVAVNSRENATGQSGRTEHPGDDQEHRLDPKIRRMPMKRPTHPLRRGNFGPEDNRIINKA